jgi:peroxiredoxin
MNMKNTPMLLMLALLAALSWQCSTTPDGTTIKGTISNAQNMQVYIDQVIIGKASNIVGKADISPSGKFEAQFPEGLEAGVYNLRIGAQRINFVLNGKEKVVEFEGDLNRMPNYDFKVSGSPDSETYAQVMRALIAQQYQADDISRFVDTVANPILGAFVAFRTLGNSPQLMPIQQKAQQKLAAAMPNSEMATEYANYLQFAEAQYYSQRANELIQVGQPAPDIKLANPNGKEYALSDLKGKVVLLDFWASWCGPCRRENPNVVEVYKRYKDKGFTVFSVSLDGLDSRTASRLSSQTELREMMENSKQRWVEAIKQDGLIWEYHVSDLKKWESFPATMYGVNSIPRTFLIDREGKIAALNLRGASAIEAELKKLL